MSREVGPFMIAARSISNMFSADPLCIYATIEGEGFSITISRPETEAEKARKELYG